MVKMVLIQDIRKINKVMIGLRENVIKNLHYVLLCDIFLLDILFVR